MANIDDEKQQHYRAKVQFYEKTIAKLLQNEAATLEECRAKPEEAACKLFALSGEMLNLMSNYLVINGITGSIFNSKNEDALNEAKKSLSKAIIYLENIVTGKVDASFSDYKDNLEELAPVTAKSRLNMVQKIGLSMDLLENAYGDNTKWRWTFVDIEGKFAAVAKNLLDLKKAQVNTDPSSPDYEPILYHLRYVIQLLGKSADRFRERFELATKRIEDLRLGISFLEALRRIYTLLNDHEELEATKKKIEHWTALMESAKAKQSRQNASNAQSAPHNAGNAQAGPHNAGSVPSSPHNAGNA